MKGRRKDRCLRSFEGYHVTLERLHGRLIWGEMRLHATGLELEYPDDVQDEYHIETSYILYKDEYPQIQAIYRYCDQMAEDQWERRQKELASSFHPGFWRRLQRRSRNILNLVSDSLNQAIDILVGQIQSSTQTISAGSDEYLSGLGANIIGYVGTKYDPLLEEYVGTKVVVEVTEDGVVYEHIGVLKDYTADYLEVLDVYYPNQAAVRMDEEQDCHEDQNLRVKREGNKLLVHNLGETSLYLQSLLAGGEVVRQLNAVLDRDDEIELHLPVETAGSIIEVKAQIVRRLDWILPRSHALVRHKAERYDPDQVFDIGVALKLDRFTDAEERYVETLKKNPQNASCAVELGRLLYQRGALSEAERWFRHALQYREDLVDGGKSAARGLRRIEKRRAGYR
jgi:tetratricopeptide (TPR) repeat protein